MDWKEGIVLVTSNFLTSVVSYFTFRGKRTDYDIEVVKHDVEACEKLRIRVNELEKTNTLLQASIIKSETRNQINKSGLKLLLVMKKNESTSNPDDVKMIEQMLVNIENE